MSNAVRFRSLSVVTIAGGACVAVTSLKNGSVACFVAGTDAERVALELGDGLIDFRQVGTGFRADLSATVMEGEPAEPSFLAGRRVLLGTRQGQSAAALRTWLSYHSAFGFDGALIFDRAPPEDAEAFAACFAGPEGMRVLFVSCDRPMGRPGAPDARDPVQAPGARSGSVPRLPFTPWHAPLSEPVLFEALRHRYLSEADVTAQLEPTDFLLPGAQSLMDRAHAASGRSVPLVGREAYPLALAAGDRGLNGHVFTRRDERRWLVSWATVASELPRAAILRPGGISGVPDDAPALPFVRAMGAVFPEAVLDEIVNPDDLVENREIRAAVEAHFGRTHPRRRPRVPVGGDHPVTVVTTMRNEGPFIVDWVAHNRVLGVDRHLVYSNDCDDGTDRLLDILAKHIPVFHRENPYQTIGKAPQRAAFRAALKEESVRSAGWLLPLDVDEYLVIHEGKGCLKDLIAAVPDATVISIPWRLFGSDDIVSFEDRPVTEQFRTAAPDFAPRPLQAWGFKTLYLNNGAFRKIGVHAPRKLNPDRANEVVWLDGSGRPLPQREWETAWRTTLATWGYGLAQINHYAVRSAESFLVKRDRGRTNHTKQDQGLEYWFRMNFNGPEERSIDAYSRRVAEERARLMALPGVAKAHADAVSWHTRRIAELLKFDDYRALFDEITSARLQKLSRRLGHFGNTVFFHGPGVIPEDMADEPVDGEWSFTVPLNQG